MAANPRLVLHFDVNKTLLMIDPASGLSARDVATDLVAASTWGVVDARDWTALQSAALSIDPPPMDTARAHTGACLRTYSDYAKNVLHPYCNDAAANRTAKAHTRALLRSFCDDGSPGAHLAALRDLILGELVARPPQPPLGPGADAAAGSLVPSFFELVRHLVDAHRDVRLMFRTFGGDLGAVVSAHNAFCDTLPGARALAVRAPGATGALMRVGRGAGDVALAFVAAAGAGDGVERVALARGVAAIARALDAHDAWALTDDYHAWWAQHEQAAGGKPMAFDHADGDEHHIFFDDNIGSSIDTVRSLPPEAIAAFARTGVSVAPSSASATDAWVGPERDAKIVDARCLRTGAALPFSALRNVHLVRVDPLSAIFSQGYFVELVAMCEARRREGRVAAGGQPESVEAAAPQ